MPEKSATAIQTAPSRLPVKEARAENLFERMDRLYDIIARRAFELFERDGWIHGRDIEHWLRAERELLHPVHIQLEETEGEFVVHAEVPGFNASDLEVSIEPYRLTISGKRESKKETKKGKEIYAEECSDEIFRAVALPAEVNTSKVTATIKDGILDVQLPKAAPAKAIRIEPQAA